MDYSSFLEQFEKQVNSLLSGDGVHHMPLDGMVIIKQTQGESGQCNQPIPALYNPCLCLILQGRKRVYFGKEECIYGVGDFLISGVDMPTLGYVTESPYLCLKLDLNTKILTEIVEQGLEIKEPSQKQNMTKGLFVGKSDIALLETLAKGIDLLKKPDEIHFLKNLFEKEWHYRLLKSEYGYYVKQLILCETVAYKLSRVIEIMKKDLSKPVYIPDCAGQASMSESSFYDHFKKFTGYTPLQYHKNLRLLEAKRLMITDGTLASQVAYDVGYESASQFNRDYKKFFGLPPLQDINRFRSSLFQFI